MSIAFHYWVKKEKCDTDWIVEQFITSNYYYMFPFKNFLIRKFDQEYDKIVSGDLTSELKEVQYIIEKRL